MTEAEKILRDFVYSQYTPIQRIFNQVLDLLSEGALEDVEALIEKGLGIINEEKKEGFNQNSIKWEGSFYMLGFDLYKKKDSYKAMNIALRAIQVIQENKPDDFSSIEDIYLQLYYLSIKEYEDKSEGFIEKTIEYAKKANQSNSVIAMYWGQLTQASIIQFNYDKAINSMSTAFKIIENDSDNSRLSDLYSVKEHLYRSMIDDHRYKDDKEKDFYLQEIEKCSALSTEYSNAYIDETMKFLKT